MRRLARVLLGAAFLTGSLMFGPTYSAEAKPSGLTVDVQRLPGDAQECARILAEHPELARREHGCWIEVTITTEALDEATAQPFGVGAVSAHHGSAAYVYFNTSIKYSGVFDVWHVTAASRWRANGWHVYPEWIDCSRFGGSFGYLVKVTWCGKGLAQSYPYTDYGANFTVTQGLFTWGKGMRQQVWANTYVCCNVAW